MAYQITCPSCQQEGLDPRFATTTCVHCAKQFSLVAYCPTCHAELERLQACGAVDYFCNSCNSMISKRQAEYKITSV